MPVNIEGRRVVTLCIALPVELWQRLKEKKVKTGIPISFQVVKAIEEAVEKETEVVE